MNFDQQENITTTDVGHINNINFTSRELDIIACLLAGRAAKKTASVLLISPRTVEIHLRNIMQKLNCNSRESIIDFVERSDKFMLIKQHYAKLLIQSAFILELQKLHRSIKKTNISCVLFYYKTQRAKNTFIAELEKHLTFAGVKIISKAWSKQQAQGFISSQANTSPVTCILYALSTEFIEQLQATGYDLTKEFLNLIPLVTCTTNPIINLILPENIPNTLKEQLLEFTCIHLTAQINYYSFVFEILQKLLPTHNITASTTAFNTQHTILIDHPATLITANHIPTTNFNPLSKIAVKATIISSLIICFGFMFFAINPYNLLSRDTNHAINEPNNIDTTIKQKIAVANETILQAQQLTSKANVWPTQNIPSSSMLLLNIPPRNTKFSGRKDALQQIKDFFEKKQIGTTIQVISGLGGIGKTQLATEFAYSAVEQNLYTAILWVTAANPNALNNAYREFAANLQIDIRGLKSPEIQSLVHSKLATLHSGSKLLFILDNVPNHNEIQDYVATLHKQLPSHFGLHILITSRSQYWPDAPIILDDFSTEEATIFVRNHLPNEKASSILRLIQTLHSFPLALGQAVAYIKAHTNIDDYLELYNAREKDYLDLFAGERNQYTESLWKTWYIALSKLSANAKKILFLSSYLYPDNIPISLFDKLSTTDKVNAIEELRRHSFIILTNNNKSFKIHRLLQEIIRLNLQGITLLEESWLMKTIELIQNNFAYDYIHCENWDLYKQYLPHAIAVAEHAIATKQPAFQVGLKLYCQIAMFLTYIQYDFTEAMQLWNKISQLLNSDQNAAKVPLSIASINAHLSYVKHGIGEVKLSKELLDKAIATYKQTKNEISKQDQNLLNDLRFVRLDDNIQPHEQIQYDTSFILIRLGGNARAIGQYEQAIAYYNEALVLLQNCENQLITDNYRASVLRDIGTAYMYNGNFIAAEDMLIKATHLVNQSVQNLHITNKITGTIPGNPLQIYIHEGLAALLYNIGKFEQSQQLLNKALDFKLSMFSKLFPETAHTYMLLGGVNAMLANITLAEHNLQQAEQIYRVHHKDSYYCYIFLYLRFSRVYETLKQYDKALDYINKTMELAQLHYGEKLHTAMSFQLSAAETWPTAIKNANITYLEKVLEITMRLFGKQHIQVARYHYLLGLAHSTQHTAQEQ